MPQARQNQISLDATSTYHCISRCVRRQYLCGVDTQTGKDFSHRRDWIRTRIFELQAIFAIDICAYAVMSNHAHLVLSVQQDIALAWDDKEVATRWLKLFGGKPLVRSFVADEKLSEAQLSAVSSMIEKYREAAVQHFLVHAVFERAYRPPGQRRRQRHRALLGRSIQEPGAAGRSVGHRGHGLRGSQSNPCRDG